MQEEQKIPFGRKEAARRLGVSVVTVDRLLAKEKLAHFKIGTRVLFNQELINNFIQANIRQAK